MSSMKRTRLVTRRPEEPGCSRWENNHNDNSSKCPVEVIQATNEARCPPAGYGLWQRPPEGFFVSVFSHLGDKERCQASLVCKDWRNIFHVASLWHRRRFVLKGGQAKEAQEKYKKFLSHLGSNIRHISLEFDRPNINTANVIATAFQEFVSDITKCPGLKLLSITVRNLDFRSGWRYFSLHRSMMVRALCSLLREQTHLKTLDLSSVQACRCEGIRILEALARDSKTQPRKKACRLQLEKFFAPSVCEWSHPKFLGIMGSFSGLTKICINQRHLSDTLLQKMTSSSAALEKMELIVDTDDVVAGQAISSNTWLAVTERCPHLTVGVQLAALCSVHKHATYLVKHLPLTEMSVTWLETAEEMKPTFLVDIERLIRHISNVFSKTITSLKLSLLPECPNASLIALRDLILKCRSLREVSLSVSLVRDVSEHTVGATILASRPPNELWHFDIRIFGLKVDERLPVLELLRDKWWPTMLVTEFTSKNSTTSPNLKMRWPDTTSVTVTFTLL